MSKLIRFGDVLINYNQLAWIGIIASTGTETVLSFQFVNPANNFTLKYADKNTANNALNLFENIVRGLETNMS